MIRSPSRDDASMRFERQQSSPSGARFEPVRRPVDFVLFLLVPLASLRVGGFPLPEVAMIVATLLAALRRPTVSRPLPGWLPALLGLLFLWMFVVAVLQDLSPVKRLLHLALFCVVAVFMARGKFSMRSVASGLATGLIIAGGAGLVGVRSAYEGRLAGFLGDPNLAGFYLLALGAVSAAHLPNDRRRMLLVVFVGVLVLLTLSRTSILAIGLVGVWVIAGRRLRPLTCIALIASLLYAIFRVSDLIRLAGPFAGRAGSDALRGRILAQEEQQIAQSPWIGNGPGTGTVDLGGEHFFFHNSYLALRNEGGWIALAIVVTLGLLALLALARMPRPRRNLWLEGALIAVATCALSLGEVLLELPAAIVLGAGVLHIQQSKCRAELDEKPPSLTSRDLDRRSNAAGHRVPGKRTCAERPPHGSNPPRL